MVPDAYQRLAKAAQTESSGTAGSSSNTPAPPKVAVEFPQKRGMKSLEQRLRKRDTVLKQSVDLQTLSFLRESFAQV